MESKSGTHQRVSGSSGFHWYTCGKVVHHQWWWPKGVCFLIFHTMPSKVLCPYCPWEKAEWGDNSRIYGRNFGKSYKCYLCTKCGAYVWCHKNSRKPLGTLANKELRGLRMQAHALFDPMWQSGKMTRKNAYTMLSDHFGHEVHIGESNEEKCKEIIYFLKSYQW